MSINELDDEKLRQLADRPCSCDAMSVSLQMCGCFCDSCEATWELGLRERERREP